MATTDKSSTDTEVQSALSRRPITAAALLAALGSITGYIAYVQNQPANIPDASITAAKLAAGVGGTTDAGALTSGTLSSGRLPAFMGDVTSPANSNTLTIAPGAVKASNLAANALPTFATVATSGNYADLVGKPAYAAIATSGSANDLTTGTLPTARLPALTGDCTANVGTGVLSCVGGASTAYTPLANAASTDGVNYTATAAGTPGANSIMTITIPTTNTAAAKLSINGGTARSFADANSTGLVAGMMEAGRTYILFNTGTSYILVGIARVTTIYDVSLLDKLFLQRSGTNVASLGFDSFNQLQINCTSKAADGVTPALGLCGTFDATTGAFRAINGLSSGATSGTATVPYDPTNPPTFTVNDASAITTAGLITNATTSESIDDFSPYIVNNTVPYYLSPGDDFRPINVTAANVFIDGQFALAGGTQEIDVDAVSSHNATLYIGPGGVFRGQPGMNNAVLPPSSVVILHRYSAGDFFLEVKNAPTPITYNANLPPARAYTWLNDGQSNGARLILGGGLAGFQERSLELGATPSPWVIQAAIGESALDCRSASANNPTNCWWNKVASTVPGNVSGANTPGPNLLALVQAIQNRPSTQPLPTIWTRDQGEKDAGCLGAAASGACKFGGETTADYKADYQALIAYVRQTVPGLPIIITPLGAQDGVSGDAGITAVREAQFAVCAADPLCTMGPEHYDLSRPYPNVHLNFGGYRAEGRRMATVIDNVLNGHTHDVGPTFSNFNQVSSTQFTVSLSPYSSMTDNSGLALQNAANPVSAIGFGIYPPGDPVGATPCAIKSIGQLFSASNKIYTFTINTAAPCDGGRLNYPAGAVALSRTGRIVTNLSTGLPARTYSSSPP